MKDSFLDQPIYFETFSREFDNVTPVGYELWRILSNVSPYKNNTIK